MHLTKLSSGLITDYDYTYGWQLKWVWYDLGKGTHTPSPQALHQQGHVFNVK